MSRSERERRPSPLILRLSNLPLVEWSRLVAASTNRVSGDVQAALRRALGATAGSFEARCARADVEALLDRFERSAEGRALTRKPGALMRVRRTTERAALAVLARDGLSDTEFTILAGAFRSLVDAPGDTQERQ